MNIYSYDRSSYNFNELLTSLFEVPSLELLHVFHKNMIQTGNIEWKDESDSKFHKIFYSKLNLKGPGNRWNEMIDCYDRFVKNEIKSKLDSNTEFLVQQFPSFRVQTPNSKAIHKWHYDSDEDHGHPIGEINVQIPITVMYDTSATWIESIPGMSNFAPMNMFPGQYSIFNGNKCTHGNKKNETGITRVSFDFRIIPKKVLENQRLNTSATLGMKFTIGEYYREM